MAKTKITLAREVTYGIPVSGADPTTPTFDRVVTNAVVESPDPMDSTQTKKEPRQLVVDLPSKGWSDDDVLAALRTTYPECDIDWQVIEPPAE